MGIFWCTFYRTMKAVLGAEEESGGTALPGGAIWSILD